MLQFMISWFSTTREDEKLFAAKHSRASPGRNGRIAVASQMPRLYASAHYISNWLLNISSKLTPFIFSQSNIHPEATPLDNLVHLATSMDITPGTY